MEYGQGGADRGRVRGAAAAQRVPGGAPGRLPAHSCAALRPRARPLLQKIFSGFLLFINSCYFTLFLFVC